MDANLADAHELVRNIRVLVEQFRPGGTPVDRQQCAYDAFEFARITENDAYEVFADDLERFRKRQLLNLGVAESDSDRYALVKRRRAYIATLATCRAKVSAVLAARACDPAYEIDTNGSLAMRLKPGNHTGKFPAEMDDGDNAFLALIFKLLFSFPHCLNLSITRRFGLEGVAVFYYILECVQGA
jgi:hypothetical protein